MNARSKISHTRASTFYLSVFLTAVLLAVMVFTGAVPVVAQSEEAATEPNGYTYTVLEGDSWGSVATKTNVDVDVLEAANPDAVRETGWLLVGEELFIPIQEEAPSQTHVVKSGESWTSIAARYGVSASLLQAANPKSMRPGYILYKGERLLIPPSGASEAALVTPEATVEEAVEEAAQETEAPAAAPAVAPTEDMTATVEVTATVEAGESEEDTTTVEETIAVTITDGMKSDEDSEVSDTAAPTTTAVISATEVTVEAPVCPEKFADYSDLMLEVINSEAGGIEALSTFLSGCGALVEESFIVADLNGDEIDDLVAVYQNPAEDSTFVEGDLIIFNSTEEGYELPYRARAAGEVRLLSTEDINGDGLLDVVWIDTTCGASTCFDTVNVRSWDGSNWTDWTDGTITMAYAEIVVDDLLEEGQGSEIELSGGIYGSVGAGPQRSRIEIWSSVDGSPYALVDKTYNASECLYHTVLDANRAFLDAPSAGFEAAEVLYEKAATDETLIKCWVRNDELEELRSFSLFRLAILSGYQDDVEAARDRITELSVTYPGSTYANAGAAWLQSFLASGDSALACADVTTYAEENPEAWEILADYGYTNPSFEAADVCPVLDLSEPGAGDDSASDSASAVSSQPAMPVAGETLDVAAFPDCPAELAGYSDILASVLEGSNGDQAMIEKWMKQCGVMDDDLGAVVLADLNSDEVGDAIFFPTMKSDLGFGPNGAQGAILIYHGKADGSYELIANPEIYGMPAPFAVGDFDVDGRTDVAWTVTGCSTFCVMEVQMWTWDGDAYVSLIQPGATIAEGEASFEPVVAGDPGSGQRLILSGGISGMPEGGLEISHIERWQSIGSGMYQRVGWEYDRTAEGSNCLGLRLVEADVAMQASAVLGYDPAIDLYTQALDPSLQACSVFGMPADEELMLLQGLAAFRLIQAQAYSGDMEAAQSTLDALSAGQPDGLYAEMAETWLMQLASGADAVAACAEIQPVLDENIDLWQITDHYGYNHPAMALEQVCYVP